MNVVRKDYDVIILGAGPAGTACALALRDADLKVALIDKSAFPRDKTCGDAIPGPCLKILDKLCKNQHVPSLDLTTSSNISHSHIFPTKGKRITIQWKAPAYNAKRVDFDHYLLQLVKETTNTTVLEATQIEQVTRTDKIELTAKNGSNVFRCELLIAGDGANSVAVRQLLPDFNKTLLTGHAIRAYYTNVDCAHNSNEFYLLDDFPGYFWIFPLANNQYNVGVGLLNPNVQKSNDIKTEMLRVIKTHPIIQRKFRNATLTSKILGFRLPLGGIDTQLTDDRLILTGDAAHLIDPLQGHGIDKAMESGVAAAEQAIQCFKLNAFDKNTLQRYDGIIQDSIGKELKRNLSVMNLLYRMPVVLRIASVLVSVNTNAVLSPFYNKRKNPAI